jgi:indolepyruvate ferredoxin oxidoreductase
VPESHRLSQSPAEAVARRVAFLTRYQDAAYAERYAARVKRVEAAEAAAMPGATALGDAVARALFKLMACKDEYEVARLYTEGDFLKRVAQNFSGSYRLRFHMAPPILGERDPQTGRPRKREFGPWMLPVLRILARFRRLRGSRLDIFARSPERQAERRLLAEYEALLDEIVAGLGAANHRVAVELALLPLEIRGFGHVKDANIARAKATEAALLRRFRSPSAPHALAAE